MSRTIDERVLSMQFDNRQFESNVQTSLGTLEKLKQSLNLTGAAKGLENIDRATKKVDMTTLGNAAYTVGLKFSAMYTMADQALRNITNRVQHCAENMIKAFTIEPVKTGLQEYETQIGAIQTILANTQSKGTTLGDVNNALDELNTYADKTIYNFTQMTRNIGTFTAAGVDLDKSVTSIKGIANLAAVSGSTSQQASTAMYQLSQALAAGRVSLMDWNSVVNAGMGGQVFQDALKRTATQMGTNVDALIDKYGSFRESLTQGQWLTSEVLTETLTQLSGAYSKADLIAQGYSESQAQEIVDLAETAVNAATKVKTFSQLIDTLKESAQSGWTQTWELLIGDFEEAKSLWTGISDTVGGFINATSEARNNLLEGALNSNWEKMVGKINDAGVETDVFEKKVKEALKENGYNVDELIKKYGSLEGVFQSGKVSSDILKKAVDGISDSVSKVDLSSITKNLKKGMKGDEIKTAQEALKALGHDLGKAGVDGIFGKDTEAAVKAFQELQGLEVTGIIDEKTLAALEKATSSAVKLDESIDGLIDGVTELGGRQKIIQSFKNIFEALKSVIKPIKDAFRTVFPPATSEQLVGLIDRFQSFTEKLKLNRDQSIKVFKAFKGLFSAIDIGWTFIKKLASGIVKLVGSFSSLGNGLLGIVGSIGDWISGLRDSIKETDIFGTAIDGIVSVLGSVIGAIGKFVSFVASKFKMPGFEGFFGLMKGIWNIVGNVMTKLAGVGTMLFDILLNAFRTGDISAALDIINSGLFGGVLIGIKKFFSSLTDSTDGIGDIVENIAGIFDTLGSALKTWQQNLKADILLKIAGAIGILAFSILILSSIDPGALTGAVVALTTLFADLLGAMEVFNLMGGVTGGGTTKAIGMMIGMSVSILILASALKKISSLSWEDLGKGLLGITVTIQILLRAVKAMSADNRTLIKGAGMMMAMSLALTILAGALHIIASLSWEELAKGVLGFGVLIFALVQAIKTLSTQGKTAVKGAGTMMIMAVALTTLSGALHIVASLSWEELAKGVLGLGVLVLALVKAVKALSVDGKTAIKGAGTMMVMAIALTTLAGVLHVISALSWEGLLKGVVTLTILMFALTMAIKAMAVDSGTSIKGAGSILIISAAMVVLAGALKKIGSLSIGTIAKGLITIALAFAVIGGAGALLGPLVPAILGLAGAFALIGLSVLAVGLGLTACAAGLGALATAVAGGATAIVAGLTVIITGIIGLIPAVAAKIGEAIVVFCGVIADSAGAIGEAVKAVILTLVDVFVECVPAIADGLMKLLAAVLASLAEYTPQIVDSLFTFLIGLIDGISERLPELIQSAVNLVMSFFTGVVDALSGLDVGTIIKGVLGMGIVAGLMVLFSVIAPLTPAAMAGILGIGAVIAELALVLTAIGALAQIPGLDWLVGEGGELIKSIGTAIGGFVGGIIGGIAEGVTDSLPGIGTNMSTFMTNLGPFIEGMKAIDESILTNAKNLVSVITSITSASLMESITSWVTGSSSMETFGTELVAFGTAVKNFSAQVSGIDEAAVTAAANAGTILANMASALPNSGGLVSMFTGENSLSTFATDLVSFGTSMKSFSTAVSGIDETAVTAAANAGSMLAGMAAAIPNSGGLVSLFAGENSILDFSADIISFGTAMKSFSTQVSGIDETAVTAAANAGTMLADLATNLPNSGGLVSLFTGENSMETFGTELVSFGTAMKNFSAQVTGIDEAAVTAAAGAGTALSTMANSLPESGGLWSIFAGDNTMEGFGKDLVSFGTAMKDFSTEVSGIDETAITVAARAATSLSLLASKLATAGDEGDFSSVATGAKGLGTRLKNFYNEIAEIESTSISTVITELGKLASVDLSGLATLDTTLSNLGKSGVSNFVSAFTDASETIKTAAEGMVTTFINGANGKKENFTKSFKTIASYGVTGAKSEYINFFNAGKYLVEGFAAGISANDYKAKAKAAAMAKAAKQAAENALGIESPSKVFYKIGAFTGQGFVNALSDYEDKTYKAGGSIADSARLGLSNAISKVRDVIENGIDAQPTIRPVLDLSDVESGAGAISGMFNSNPSVTAMGHVGAISSMMAKGQNGTNGDVISAINDLGKKLGNVSGNTYQVNGVTYDDGSNVASAVNALIRAARVERRV